MRIELWSIYFDPVPLGIGPVAGTLAKELAARGHEVTVVTSHPHYPKPGWGTSWRTKSRVWKGVTVFELPVYTRRQTVAQRALEELTYAFKQTAWALRRRRPDVVIATVPSLLCVPGAIWRSRVQDVPVVLWLQDVVSAAAGQTGLSGGSRLAPLLARLERSAFFNASRTVVISDAFRRRLLELGVPEDRVTRIYLGAPRDVKPLGGATSTGTPPVVLVIGNIGLTQNLAEFVRAFQESAALTELGAELRITGDGVAVGALKEAIAGDHVRYLGVVSDQELERELENATVGLVSQGSGVLDFNLPSKTITYMAAGLPVCAVADPGTELFGLVSETGAGLAVSNADLARACSALAGLLGDREGLRAAREASLAFASANFDAAAMAAKFERVLEDAVS